MNCLSGGSACVQSSRTSWLRGHLSRAGLLNLGRLRGHSAKYQRSKGPQPKNDGPILDVYNDFVTGFMKILIIKETATFPSIEARPNLILLKDYGWNEVIEFDQIRLYSQNV